MQNNKSSIQTHDLEHKLVEPVARYLRSLGCEIVVPELRFFDRGIDLYGIKYGRPGTTFAVELKLTKWQRAIQQAAVYQLCADFAFVALPIRSALKMDLQHFKRCGVGVLLVRPDGTIGRLLEAERSPETRRDYIKALTCHATEVLEYA